MSQPGRSSRVSFAKIGTPNSASKSKERILVEHGRIDLVLQEIHQISVGFEESNDFIKVAEDDHGSLKGFLAQRECRRRIAGSGNEDAAGLSPEEDAHEVSRNVIYANWVFQPLHFNEIGLTGELNSAVDLLVDIPPVFASNRKGFANENPIGSEKAIEHTFQRLAADLRICHREQGEKVLLDDAELLLFLFLAFDLGRVFV
jgi:hypothetical protein